MNKTTDKSFKKNSKRRKHCTCIPQRSGMIHKENKNKALFVVSSI